MSAALDLEGNIIMFGLQSNHTIIKIVILRDGTFNQQVLNQGEFEQAKNQALAVDRGRVMTMSDAQVETLATHFGISPAGIRS